MRFRSVVVLGGKTATGFRVPADVVARLGKGKRPPVRVTIAGHMYRSTVAVMGGEYWLGISADVRAMTGARAGEEVDVDVELDTEPREVVVPADFAAALDGDGEARRAFDAMSYSNRRRLVMAVDDAKTDETRVR
ncbi:MAG TPA: YdeI/OmpD-associated family protein, partial [Candidatus Dormibacteraeota bacterium]